MVTVLHRSVGPITGSFMSKVGIKMSEKRAKKVTPSERRGPQRTINLTQEKDEKYLYPLIYIIM